MNISAVASILSNEHFQENAVPEEVCGPAVSKLCYGVVRLQGK